VRSHFPRLRVLVGLASALLTFSGGGARASLEDPYGILESPDGGAGVNIEGLRAWLQAILEDHPAVRGADARLESASALADAAEGAFDFNLLANSGYAPLGKYEQLRAGLGFDQATTLWGLRVQGGYRQGDGFAPYYGGRFTGTGGEFHVDLSVPLWRDRDIDSRRYKLWSMALKRDAEAIKAQMRRLGVAVDATLRYWRWVEAVWEAKVAESLLGVATARELQIAGRVRSGQAPAIDIVDNARLVLARRSRLAQAQGKVARAAADLEVYATGWGAARRREEGAPRQQAQGTSIPASPETLPVTRPWTEAGRQGLKAVALEERPDLALFRQVGELLELDLRNAQNKLGPRVDVRAWARQQLGEARQIGPGVEVPTEVGFGVSFALPVQQREARGEIRAVEAELQALEEDLRLAEAQVDASLDGLLAELDALHAQAGFAAGAYEAAVRLEGAERRSFQLGQSNLVIVNLREEATAEAALGLVRARVGWFLAAAAVYAAAGRIPDPAAALGAQ